MTKRCVHGRRWQLQHRAAWQTTVVRCGDSGEPWRQPRTGAAKSTRKDRQRQRWWRRQPGAAAETAAACCGGSRGQRRRRTAAAATATRAALSHRAAFGDCQHPSYRPTQRGLTRTRGLVSVGSRDCNDSNTPTGEIFIHGPGGDGAPPDLSSESRRTSARAMRARSLSSASGTPVRRGAPEARSFCRGGRNRRRVRT